MKNISLLILLLLMLYACKSNNTALSNIDYKNYKVGNFEPDVVSKIKTHLKKITNEPLKDTIYIKYEYSNKKCWTLVDHKEEAEIYKVIYSQNRYYHKESSKHSGASLFRIKEDANWFNQFIKLNDVILTDKDNQIKNTLNLKNEDCGNSLVIFEDGSYIVKYNDSHLTLINYNKEKLTKLLNHKTKTLAQQP